MHTNLARQVDQIKENAPVGLPVDLIKVDSFVNDAPLSLRRIVTGQRDPNLVVQNSEEQEGEYEGVPQINLLQIICHKLVCAMDCPWCYNYVLLYRFHVKKSHVSNRIQP